MKYVSVVIIVAFSFKAYAANYYVATNGNDNSVGTEISPWGTIQKAADVLIAGDTVFIKSGTYNERVEPKNSGSPGKFIVYTIYPGAKVTIDGADISWWEWNGLFDLSDKAYVVVLGIKLVNSFYGGIWIENSKYITIKNTSTYNTVSCGIGVWSSNNVMIDSNHVELACNDGEQECISIAGSYECVIKSNHVHHNGQGTIGGEGIDIKAGSHDIVVYGNYIHDINNRIGLYVDAWENHTYNIRLFQNIVHNCTDSGIAVATEKGGLLENVRIFNNIVYHNKWSGFEVGSWTAGQVANTPIKNVQIVNNTFYDNGLSGGGAITINNPDAENILIRNNICSKNKSYQIAIESAALEQVIADHNLIDGYRDAQYEIYGSDSVVGNPSFQNPAMANFHLNESSSAINSGLGEYAPDMDFDGKARPDDTFWDIGAFEYYSSLGVFNNNKEQLKTVIYPNPFSYSAKLCFDTLEGKTYLVSIFNIQGEIMRRITNVSDNCVEIKRINLVNGIYFFQVCLGSKICAKGKFIIK